MAKSRQPEKLGFKGTMKQLRLAFVFTAKRDKLFLPILAGAEALAITATVLLVIYSGWFTLLAGIMLILLAALIVLNVRVSKVIMAEAEQTPGSAAGVVERMRGDFRVTPGVSSTTSMDFVHLVVCRAGVVLIGEGDPGRVRNLMNQEKRRLAKVIGNADLREITIGHGEGQVPLKKLRLELVRLPRTLSKAEVISLDKRLTALTARPQLPKGAIPKNMRPPKGAFRAMRGGPR